MPTTCRTRGAGRSRPGSTAARPRSSFSGSWQRVVSARTVVAGLGLRRAWRRHAVRLAGGHAGYRPTAPPRRPAVGLLSSLTQQRGRHTIKVGGELSALRSTSASRSPSPTRTRRRTPGSATRPSRTMPDNPFEFAGSPSSLHSWSAYAQDAFQVSNASRSTSACAWIAARSCYVATASGARGSASRGACATARRSAPRSCGCSSRRKPSTSSSRHRRRPARSRPSSMTTTIGGGSDVPPERQTALDLSLAQDFGRGSSLDASAWSRRATDVGDPNVFFGTTVTVPNSVARQRAAGFEFRLAAAPRHGWSGSLSYSHARVVQFGPVTGGLFLEDEVAAIQDGTALHSRSRSTPCPRRHGELRARAEATSRLRHVAVSDRHAGRHRGGRCR